MSGTGMPGRRKMRALPLDLAVTAVPQPYPVLASASQASQTPPEQATSPAHISGAATKHLLETLNIPAAHLRPAHRKPLTMRTCLPISSVFALELLIAGALLLSFIPH